MATTERDYYAVLGVERGASDAEIKSAFRKLAQQWHPDVNQEPRRHERFKEINEAYQVLSDPAAPPGATTCSGGPASVAAAGRLRASAGFGGFGDIFDAFFGGAPAGRRRPGAAGRRPARTSATTSGSRSRRRSAAPRRRSSSRSSGACETCAGQRREARDRADDLPAVRRPRRDPRRSARRCSARWSTSRPARAAAARAGSSRRRARRARATAGRERKRTLRVTIPAGHRRGPPDPPLERGRGRAARRPAGQPLRRGPRRAAPDAASARGPSSYYEPTSRSPRPRSGRRIRVPTVDGEEEVEIKAGHPARDRDPAARPGRAAPAPGGRRAATSTCSSTSTVPTKLSKRAARGARGVRRGGRRGGRRTRRGRRPRAGSKDAPGGERGRPGADDGLRRTATALARARGRRRHRGGRGRQRDPRPRRAGRDERRAGVRARRRGPRRARRPDPARRSSGPTCRPATRRRPRRAVGAGDRRRSATSRPSGCGRSASSGRGSSTRPTGPRPGRRHFPVLRVGRRLVIRPTWRRHRRAPGDVVIALDPGMAFGTGLHPTTRLCLAALERAGRPRRRSTARGVLDVGCGSGILAIAAVRLGAATRSASTPTRSRSRRRLANARRNRLARAARAPAQGSLPTGEPAVRPRPREPHRLGPRRARRRARAPSCGRAARCSRRGSSSTARPEVRAAFDGAGLRRRRPRTPRATGWPSRPVRRACSGAAGDEPTTIGRPDAARLFPILLADPRRRSRSRCSCRSLLCRSRCARARCDRREPGPASSGFLLWLQAHGTVVIGVGLALTGVAMLVVLGPTLLEQPWLLVALATYAVTVARGVRRSSGPACAGSSGRGRAATEPTARPGASGRPPPALRRLRDHDGRRA